jgi:hypothetical protein
MSNRTGTAKRPSVARTCVLGRNVDGRARCRVDLGSADGELGAVGERNEAHELVHHPEGSLHRGPARGQTSEVSGAAG